MERDEVVEYKERTDDDDEYDEVRITRNIIYVRCIPFLFECSSTIFICCNVDSLVGKRKKEARAVSQESLVQGRARKMTKTAETGEQMMRRRRRRKTMMREMLQNTNSSLMRLAQ